MRNNRKENKSHVVKRLPKGNVLDFNVLRTKYNGRFSRFKYGFDNQMLQQKK
jgi:hypothetical protein